MMDEELLKRIRELESENQYLKQLLKEKNIEFEMPKIIIKCNMSQNEKIDLFTSYFVGRDDIFAYQFINNDGKKACYPVCKHKTNHYPYCEKGKKCSLCDIKEYRGINKEDIENHLRGRAIYGIYPMLDDNKTNFLAFDFDDQDFKNSSLSFSAVCKKYDLDVLIEISQSGAGAHVWMFFDSPIKASKARKLGTHLLSLAMNESRSINFSSFDRMFPSQDTLPIDKKYGNLIILPLQGLKAKEGKTVFVDNNFIPYDLDKQLSILKETKKITEVEVDYLLELFKDDDSLGLLPKNVLKNLNLSIKDFPNELSIIKKNELIIPKDGFSNKGIKFMYRLGSVANPEYYELIKRKQIIYAYGNIRYPRVKRLYREDDTFIYLPRGCEDNLDTVLTHLKVNVKIDDKRDAGELIFPLFTGELRIEQKEALEQLIKYDNGILVAPPAFGKTVVAIATIAKHQVNTLVIVPKLSLIEQWKERLDNFLSIGFDNFKNKKDKYGTYTGSKKKLTNYIDIASIDSLTSEEGKKIMNKYGMVLIDEVHHIGAVSYEEVARLCSSKYLYGFTATPKRSDNNHTIIFKTIGEIRYEYKDIKHSEFIRLLSPKFTHFSFSREQTTLSYSEQISILLNDDERNEQIINELIGKIHTGKNILLLTDRIEHLKYLKEKLCEKEVEKVLVISGDSSIKERDSVLSQLEEIESGFIVLSTGKFIGEGFDQSKFDTLFITSPFRGKGTLSQYVGRLHRTRNNKTSVEVIDFIDIKVGVFSSMYHDRLSGYKKEKYVLLSDKDYYQKQIFSSFEYQGKLEEDLRTSYSEVVMVINEYDKEKLKGILEKCTKKVEIYSPVVIDGQNAIQTNFQTNIIVVDKRIVWYGGANPFLNSNYNSDIMRIDDKGVAEDLLKEISNSK